MMRVVLKAGSHPESGDIVVQDGLYAVGRREEPFASMDSSGATKLSRRHARIFVEGDAAYIVDLGSTNGTQVAGRLLGTEPAQLNDGDEVIFGGEIMFRVEISGALDEATVLAETPSVRLILTPDHSELAPVVVNSFPFLVSRNDQWIRDYETQFPEDVKELSRRHALIVMKGAKPYVEDLDSANGTFVSGERLDELARALNDGDTLAFGTGHFSFKVEVQRSLDERTVVAAPADHDATKIVETGGQAAPAEAAAQPEATPQTRSENPTASAEPAAEQEALKPSEPASVPERSEDEAPQKTPTHAVDENPKTVYLDGSATSFINEVYRSEAPEPEQAQDAEEASASGARVGRLAKARAVSGGLADALETGPSTGRKLATGALAAVVLAAAGFGVNYLLGADRREVEALLDEKDYAASAAAANAYLADHASDEEVDDWGVDALLNALVPNWLAEVDGGNYDEASRLVEDAAAAYPHLPSAAGFLGILDWGTRVEAHMAQRSEGSASLFEMGDGVRDLVAEWDLDVYANRRLMVQLSEYVPAFEPVEARLTSTLRTFRNESSLYLKGIDNLRSDIVEKLRSDQADEISTSILDFEVRFPDIRGTVPLRDDLSRYQRLEALVENRDLLAIQTFRNNEVFVTSVFADYVDTWLGGLLPPADIVRQFETANQLWRTGDLGDAIATYQSLLDTQWDDLAEMEIDRAQKVMDEFQQLQTSRDADNYTQRLLAFRNQLVTGRDDYFVQALRADIGAEEETLRAQLEQKSAFARSQWDAFETSGGIPSVMRLQDTLTDSYRLQTTRLSESLTAIVEATDAYALIESQPPSDWLELRVEVINEIVRQRRALEGLKRVMDPAVVESKLALLPQVEESV